MDSINEMQLLMQLHLNNDRQGPGGKLETCQALNLCRLNMDMNRHLHIADIGCGTGGQTLTLAEELDAEITAIDLSPEFLEKLHEHAKGKGLNKKIHTLQASMDELPLADETFDLIWSEGAIYNIGFRHGLELWHRLLKPGGLIALSEISWLTNQRPATVNKYWTNIYPEIDTVTGKLQVLEATGYLPLAHFILPEHCWTLNYYQPLQQAHQRFLTENHQSAMAMEIVKNDMEEFNVYQQYKAYYSYGFYIAKKI